MNFSTYRNIKNKLIILFNAYRLKEILILYKYHKLSYEKMKTSMLIATMDGKRDSMGLTDRLNGILSIYALAKATNTEFRIMHTHPFNLNEFLIPNKYNWIPEDAELCTSTSNIRYAIMRKQPTLKKLISLFPLKKQIRVYANYNYIDEVNREYGADYKSNELFWELFRPTVELDTELSFHKEKIGETYIACVFRFQSLLGDFKEYKYKTLNKDEQTQLICINKNALLRLVQTNNCPVLVTSDSIRFIDEIKSIKNVYTMPGKVVHVGCSFGEEKNVYMKSFIDFFMISAAKKVYSIGTSKMYPTSFPMFAAKINNVPFERVVID